MRMELMEVLVCPMCKGDLQLNVAVREGDEIVAGTLRCEECAEDYPIVDTIPNMLPPSFRE